MKKLKPHTLLFINLLLIAWPPKNTNSCGFYLYKEEYRFWTFDPFMSNEPGLQPFFYSMDLYHEGFNQNNNYYDESESENYLEDGEYEQNVVMWMNYCKVIDPKCKISKRDIQTILYETEPINYFQLREGLLTQNTFLEFAHKRPELIKYIDFAKKSEYQSNSRLMWTCPDCPEIVAPGKIKPAEDKYYYFDYDVRPDPINGTDAIEQGKIYFKTCKDEFLKLRYAYQIVRMSYYNLDSFSMSYYYHQYLKNLPEGNWLRNNAMMYEVLFHDGAERNYGLSKIFDACPDKRFRCEELFVNALFDETLKLAKNEHERAVIQVIHALHQPNEQLEAIQNIIGIEPNNVYLPLLWVREINKLEDWLLGPDYNGFGSTKNESFLDYAEVADNAIQEQKLRDLKYAKQVLNVMEQGMNNGNIPNNSFYHLCTGYIAFTCKDLVQAEKHYSNVKLNELNDIGKTQFLISNFMLHLSQTEKVNVQMENDLASCLNHLIKNSELHKQYKTLSHQLINFAAGEFRRRGAEAKGLMLYGHSDQPYAYHPLLGLGNVYTQIFSYATPLQIDEILFIIHKPNPNALELFLRSKVYDYSYEYEQEKSDWDEDKLLDLKSMKLVQQDKLILAYEAVIKIDTSYWSNEVNRMFRKDDPFCLNPWDGHATMNYRNVSYNKRTFLKELIELKMKMSKSNGEEKARLLLKIANAYYSMSYFGKFWIMQKNFQGGWEMEIETEKVGNLRFPGDVDPTYYTGARAKYYYHEILKTSKDPKLLGATVYILNTAFENNELQLNKNRALLKKNSSAIDFYEQLSANCDLYYEFIKRYN